MKVVTNTCCLVHWVICGDSPLNSRSAYTVSVGKALVRTKVLSSPLSAYWHGWKLSKIKASFQVTGLRDLQGLLLRPFVVWILHFSPAVLFSRKKRRERKQLVVWISLQCIWFNISQALQSCYLASCYVSLCQVSQWDDKKEIVKGCWAELTWWKSESVAAYPLLASVMAETENTSHLQSLWLLFRVKP